MIAVAVACCVAGWVLGMPVVRAYRAVAAFAR